jgi:hypothetical protein
MIRSALLLDNIVNQANLPERINSMQCGDWRRTGRPATALAWASDSRTSECHWFLRPIARLFIHGIARPALHTGASFRLGMIALRASLPACPRACN